MQMGRSLKPTGVGGWGCAEHSDKIHKCIQVDTNTKKCVPTQTQTCRCAVGHSKGFSKPRC